MRIAEILRSKGSEVFTIRPDASVGAAAEELAVRGVGALVVSGDGRSVDGILSERDIVRCLAADGPATLDRSVAELMTEQVHTCTPEAVLDDTLAQMTANRFRHVPVVDAGTLVGIVSIGDVVKRRLDELEVETDQLHAYITGR